MNCGCISELFDDDAPPNVYSVLATVRMSGYRWDTNKQRKAISASDGVKFSYVCTPLLGSLADFMLAMLLQVGFHYWEFLIF